MCLLLLEEEDVPCICVGLTLDTPTGVAILGLAFFFFLPSFQSGIFWIDYLVWQQPLT